MRVFVFGDCHFGFSKFSSVEKVQWEIERWVLDNVERYGCDMVVFLGDRFKKRDPEGVVRDRADEIFLNIAKRVDRMICVCGNHDFYYKVGRENSYGVLGRMSDGKIFVVDNWFDVVVGDRKLRFIAWGCDLSEVPREEVDIVFGHFEFEDMFFWSKSGVRVSDLCFSRYIFSGHIHYPVFDERVLGDSRVVSVVYLGVPYERGFGDDSSVGGVVIDLSDMSFVSVGGFGVRFVRYDGSFERVGGNIVYVDERYVREDPVLLEKLKDAGAVDVVVCKEEVEYEIDLSDVERELRVERSGIDYYVLLDDYAKVVGLREEEVEFGKEFLRRALNG